MSINTLHKGDDDDNNSNNNCVVVKNNTKLWTWISRIGVAYNVAIVGHSEYFNQSKDRLTCKDMTTGKPNTLYKKKLI